MLVEQLRQTFVDFLVIFIIGFQCLLEVLRQLAHANVPFALQLFMISLALLYRIFECKTWQNLYLSEIDQARPTLAKTKVTF